MPRFTPTEERMLKLLADGATHSKMELLGCINDELATSDNLHVHLSNIRKKLLPVGQTIYCDRYTDNGHGERVGFRHVRLIAGGRGHE